jgi:23S rRNA pseudouridine1911/1915/1917 synthase
MPSSVKRIAPASPPRLLFSNDDYAVVEKPAHLLCHPTRPDGQFTLLEWLRSQYTDQPVALINRLDRETSGLVLAALNTQAASQLGKMTMRREIDKVYLAVVHGTPDPANARIDAPIGRMGLSESNPIYLRQTVRSDGAAAQTEYKVLASGKEFSLLEVKTFTGRLHQIRVHLAHIGHPVVGDKLYGPDPLLYLKFIDEGWTEEHQRLLHLTHHALHAQQLSFDWNGERVHYESPLGGDVAEFVRAHIPTHRLE